MEITLFIVFLTYLLFQTKDNKNRIIKKSFSVYYDDRTKKLYRLDYINFFIVPLVLSILIMINLSNLKPLLSMIFLVDLIGSATILIFILLFHKSNFECENKVAIRVKKETLYSSFLILILCMICVLCVMMLNMFEITIFRLFFEFVIIYLNLIVFKVLTMIVYRIYCLMNL